MTTATSDTSSAVGVKKTINALLNEWDLKQTQLAAALGWDLQKLNRHMNGHSKWDIEKLNAVASHFGLEGGAGDLLFGSSWALARLPASSAPKSNDRYLSGSAISFTSPQVA